MALTLDQFKALTFGYLTGADLARYCPSPLLIKQYEVDNDTLTTGCATALVQITQAAVNYYNIAQELAKTDTARNLDVVRITSLLAIANALGSAQAISEKLQLDLQQARKDLTAIRMGQYQLALEVPPLVTKTDEHGRQITYDPASEAGLVQSNFLTLG